jgi:hypothetical protein
VVSVARVLGIRRGAPRVALALGLGLCACSRGDKKPAPVIRDVTTTKPVTGPDPLVLRVPRGGGLARVVAFPQVDSTIWTSTGALPALDHVLAFDDDEGSIAFVDIHGRSGRLNLRVGTVSITSRERLLSPASVSGSTIFGVTLSGSVVRMTPVGDWTFVPPRPARLVFPQRDTSILVLSGEGDATTLWRVRPPLQAVKDSLHIPAVTRSVPTPLGDRVYFASKAGLFAVDTRTLKATGRIRAIRGVAAMAVTPSGDRVYVATDSSNTIQIVDRYRNQLAGQISLPRRVSGLRLDPLGKYLLARDSTRDSVWIVAVGTNRLIGTVRSAWRGDLPFVAPNGAIATAVGRDVWFIDPIALRPLVHVPDGASDFWFGFWWTGLRPQATALDQPVPLDTMRDTAALAPPPAAPLSPADTTSVHAARPKADSTPFTQNGFWIQFAAYLVQQRAQDLAAQIHVGRENASIVVGIVNGVPIYRVVLGPYPTREEADRIAAASGQASTYVHAGPP